MRVKEGEWLCRSGTRSLRWYARSHCGRGWDGRAASVRKGRQTHLLIAPPFSDTITAISPVTIFFFTDVRVTQLADHKSLQAIQREYKRGSRAGKLDTDDAQHHQSEVESHTTLPDVLKYTHNKRIKVPPKAETGRTLAPDVTRFERMRPPLERNSVGEGHQGQVSTPPQCLRTHPP